MQARLECVSTSTEWEFAASDLRILGLRSIVGMRVVLEACILKHKIWISLTGCWVCCMRFVRSRFAWCRDIGSKYASVVMRPRALHEWIMLKYRKDVLAMEHLTLATAGGANALIHDNGRPKHSSHLYFWMQWFAKRASFWDAGWFLMLGVGMNFWGDLSLHCYARLANRGSSICWCSKDSAIARWFKQIGKASQLWDRLSPMCEVMHTRWQFFWPFAWTG